MNKRSTAFAQGQRSLSFRLCCLVRRTIRTMQSWLNTKRDASTSAQSTSQQNCRSGIYRHHSCPSRYLAGSITTSTRSVFATSDYETGRQSISSRSVNSRSSSNPSHSRHASTESLPSRPPGLAIIPAKELNTHTMKRPRDVKCWYFLYGNCKFGNRCVNSHSPYLVDEQPRPVPEVLENSSSSSSGTLPNHTYRRASPAFSHSSYSSQTSASISSNNGARTSAMTRTATQDTSRTSPQWSPIQDSFDLLESPKDVISIDEALLLDVEDENRMLAFLTKDLRQFVSGLEVSQY